MNDLLDKLELIYQRWLQIGEEITKPDVMSDMKNYVKLSKDYKDLQAVVDAYKKYKDVIDNIANAKDIVANEKDEEFREMAKMELDSYLSEKETLEEEIRLLLLPSDPQDSKNAQMEIRAGTGGDEASIFAAAGLSPDADGIASINTIQFKCQMSFDFWSISLFIQKSVRAAFASLLAGILCQMHQHPHPSHNNPGVSDILR